VSSFVNSIFLHFQQLQETTSATQLNLLKVFYWEIDSCHLRFFSPYSNRIQNGAGSTANREILISSNYVMSVKYGT